MQRLALVLPFILSAILPIDAFGAANNARMNACVKLLQRQDPGLRNGWRKSCGEDALKKEIENSGGPPLNTNLFSELFTPGAPAPMLQPSACSATPVKPAIPQMQRCGLGSKTLAENLSNDITVSIKMPDKTCTRVIPILLTNKTDFACNAVQSRIACLDWSFDETKAQTTIKLFTRRSGIADFVTATVGTAEWKAAQGRLDALIRHPQFVLIPATIEGKDVVKQINKAVDADRNDCIKHSGNSEAYCQLRSKTRADALLQEVIRRYKDPKHFIAKEDKRRQAVSLVNFIRPIQTEGKLEQWIYFLSIADNEVGLTVDRDRVDSYDPIYALSDAVILNSGLSFGAHQIDIGANSGSDLKLFWDIVSKYQEKAPDPLRAKAAAMKDCIELPLRYMTVRAIELTYEVAPKLSETLYSEAGMTAYNEHLKKYLAEAVPSTTTLPGLFQKSLIARVLYADQMNQHGQADDVKDLVDKQSASGRDFGRCDNITVAENEILARVIWKDPSDHTIGKRPFSNRYKTIQRIVRANAVNGGLSGCV